jgi:predicted NBD/HSP70 family sugar kinase
VRSLDDLQALVAAGDADTVAALRTAGRDIGEALVGVVTGIAPNVVVLGGRMTLLGDHLTTGVRESLMRYTLPALSSRVRVTTTTKHRAAGLRGGGELAFDQLLA